MKNFGQIASVNISGFSCIMRMDKQKTTALILVNQNTHLVVLVII